MTYVQLVKFNLLMSKSLEIFYLIYIKHFINKNCLKESRKLLIEWIYEIWNENINYYRNFYKNSFLYNIK